MSAFGSSDENGVSKNCYADIVTLGDSGSLQRNDWVISTRATHHICNDINVFTNVRSVQGFTVTMLTGKAIPVSKMGDVDLNGGLFLKNVLYVPEFRANLVSVGMLIIASEKLLLEFDSDKVVIQDSKTKKTICVGIEVDGLLVIRD